MARKKAPPKPKSWSDRATKRWQQTSIISRVMVLGALLITVSGSITGITNSYSIVEPGVPTWRGWVREYVKEIVLPITKELEKLTLAIDRQTLVYLEERLEHVKKDPALANSIELQRRSDVLSRQILSTKARICKASGRFCPS